MQKLAFDEVKDYETRCLDNPAQVDELLEAQLERELERQEKRINL